MKKEKFKMLSAKEEALLSKDEKIKYYQEKRNFYRKAPVNIFYIKLVEAIRKSLIKVAANRRNYEIVYLNDLEVPNDGFIVASNHRGPEDIPIMVEAIGEPFFTLLANDVPSPIGVNIILKLLGAIPFSRLIRSEKQWACEHLSKICAKGYNGAIFPEAVWNTTDSKLLLHIWAGIIDIAKNSGKPIIPVAMDEIDGKIYINFGQPFKVNPWDEREITAIHLRDKIAESLLGIWESFPKLTREETIDSYKPLELSGNGVTHNKKYEAQFIYRPKNPYSLSSEREITYEEVIDLDRNVLVAQTIKPKEMNYAEYKDFDLKEAQSIVEFDRQKRKLEYESSVCEHVYEEPCRLIKRK